MLFVLKDVALLSFKRAIFFLKFMSILRKQPVYLKNKLTNPDLKIVTMFRSLQPRPNWKASILP